MKTNIEIKLLSPLAHFSDERLSTMQLQRTMKFEHEGEFIDIPVYSGNAFRGQLRRIAMKDFLDRVGISEEGISAKLYYMLFTGGALTSGSRYNEMGKKREMRKMCPPLALFGTALGDQIPEGKMKVGIFRPICKETQDFTGQESDKSFYDMLQTVFYTRRDDLKSKVENITDETKHDNAVQMKYEMQCLSAGTKLLGSIVIENDNEVEKSCLKSILEKLKEVPYVGGKSATGHGEIEATYSIDADINTYYNYLEENKEEIRTWLREVEAIL